MRVTVTQGKAEFAAMVARAEKGDEVIITRNGKPVARLGPIGTKPLEFGDLSGLRVDDDLTLPTDIIDSFESGQ